MVQGILYAGDNAFSTVPPVINGWRHYYMRTNIIKKWFRDRCLSSATGLICSFQFATPRFCVAVINTGEMNAYRANWHNHYSTHGSWNLQAHNIEYMSWGKDRHTATCTTKPETECGFLRNSRKKGNCSRDRFFVRRNQWTQQIINGRHRGHCC